MSRPILFGSDYSVYVRIARMTLIEKGVDHELMPVDVFAEEGVPGWYRERQPFGRIPAFEHGGLRLYETSAIARYVDEAFAGPVLQPADAVGRATMNQIVGLLDSYAYRALVWDIYVERLSKPKWGEVPDEARIAAALPIAATCLAELARLRGDGPWLAGAQLTLADLHAAPMFFYFLKAPEGMALLAAQPGLAAWWAAIAARPSFAATEPAE
jgi:glutathione S-transferase